MKLTACPPTPSPSYKQLEGTKDSEVRRGQRLFAGGMNINAQKITDVAVREAIFAAVDREALRKVRFNGLNWEEPSSGSMMLLPFSEYYQDNYPVKETGADAAKKVLTDAGYTAERRRHHGEGRRARRLQDQQLR